MAVHPEDAHRSADDHMVMAQDALRAIEGLLMDVSTEAGATLTFTRPNDLLALISLVGHEFDRAAKQALLEKRSKPV